MLRRDKNTSGISPKPTGEAYLRDGAEERSTSMTPSSSSPSRRKMNISTAALFRTTLHRREILLTLRRRPAAGKEPKSPDDQIAMRNPNPNLLS